MFNWKYSLSLALLLVAGCGGGSSSGGSIAPPPTNDPPPTTVPEIVLQQVFTQLPLTQSLAMKQAPGDSTRWFVVERQGFVQVFANDPNVSESDPFLDISSIVNTSGEGGLLGIAFHPNFPQTPEVFVAYTRTGSGGNPLESYVSRIFSPDNGLTLDADTEQVLFTIQQEQSNHNGGDVHFGPDGYLYVALGDSGGGGDPRGYGQATNVLHGSIVRLNVDGNAPYDIPVGNPFAGNALCIQGFGADPCPEIFAWGLRNPWRFSFDSVTGKLWAGDVGQSAWEEIDVIEAGLNYGWNVREGAHCYPPGSSCGTSGLTDPVTEYGRSLGVSVTGGYVYRGLAVPDLVGWYVFGDFGSGRIFAIPEDSDPGAVPEVLLESGISIVAFGEANDGELYVVDLAGTMHEVQAAP